MKTQVMAMLLIVALLALIVSGCGKGPENSGLTGEQPSQAGASQVSGDSAAVDSLDADLSDSDLANTDAEISEIANW